MSRHDVRLCALLIAGFVATPGTRAVEDPSPKQAKRDAAEEKAIERCCELIRGCQLADGAFSMVAAGKPGADVWIAPYFAHHAALALLAAHDAKKSPQDVARVGRWLAWCADRQEPGGYWCDHTGTAANYQSNGKTDAHDSSAALHLLVVERYQRAGGKMTDKLDGSVKAAEKCLAGLTDKDGLTWAKTDYRVKYLMDNVEVYAGLRAAERFWKGRGDAERSTAAGKAAAALGKGLGAFWEAKENGRFAWALHPNGAYDGGFDKLYPHGLAQLFGVAFVRAEPDVFRQVAKTFEPHTTPEGIGAERYLIAAARVGDKEAATWRAKTVKASERFTPGAAYVHRPALVVLGLLEGAGWMPGIVTTEKR